MTVGQNPNPGSKAAQGMGCICAVLDNNHGLTAPWPPSGWWITEGCPVHTTPSLVQPELEPAA